VRPVRAIEILVLAQDGHQVAARCNHRAVGSATAPGRPGPSRRWPSPK
jgi:hypothetical protein